MLQIVKRISDNEKELNLIKVSLSEDEPITLFTKRVESDGRSGSLTSDLAILRYLSKAAAPANESLASHTICDPKREAQLVKKLK